jgi:hypothetical protein
VAHLVPGGVDGAIASPLPAWLRGSDQSTSREVASIVMVPIVVSVPCGVTWMR